MFTCFCAGLLTPVLPRSPHLPNALPAKAPLCRDRSIKHQCRAPGCVVSGRSRPGSPEMKDASAGLMGSEGGALTGTGNGLCHVLRWPRSGGVRRNLQRQVSFCSHGAGVRRGSGSFSGKSPLIAAARTAPLKGACPVAGDSTASPGLVTLIRPDGSPGGVGSLMSCPLPVLPP